jgi:hypothetical protein
MFSFSSPILGFMFQGPESSKRVVVHCKGCGENIPAPVEKVPSQPVAARCPLCDEHRRYLPSEVFLDRLSHLMIRKPVRSADGRVG